jgi:hypothetical protein
MALQRSPSPSARPFDDGRPGDWHARSVGDVATALKSDLEEWPARRVIVREGLAAGERVVVDPAWGGQADRTGQEVRTREEPDDF